MEEKKKEIRISVRNLVEFILRSGDLDTGSQTLRDTQAMQEGSAVHKKIQKIFDSPRRCIKLGNISGLSAYTERNAKEVLT